MDDGQGISLADDESAGNGDGDGNDGSAQEGAWERGSGCGSVDGAGQVLGEWRACCGNEGPQPCTGDIGWRGRRQRRPRVRATAALAEDLGWERTS
jgi:hypothetical protein